MADRTVRVVLQAVTQQFDAALQKAAGSAKSLGQELQSASKSGALDDIAGHATMIGGAWTAVNAVVAKTGIEYNTLQQTSRAALTTLTGSARDANAQMDKLDAFATTSPFAKDVFIKAQQQMLGFGIEAGRVIPYLSAINDATAAMGGNNHTVAELSRIMAQISASAKITATDLREFGNRGIDAATIIGSQMGKTGAQIRDDITAGTLDAQVALDALAAGMSERFAGASANVKDTMAGAFDRVKAAFRDLSAEIVSGAVSPDGGGWLVDWTNGLADMLRTVQKIPDPIKQTAGALSGIGGVALLATGGMVKLVTSGVKVHEAFEDLQRISPRLSASLGEVAKGFGLVAAALAIISVAEVVRDTFVGVTQDAEDMAGTLANVARGALDLDAAFRKVDGSALRSGGLSLTQGWIGDLDSIENFTKAFLSRVDYMDKEGGKLFGIISTGATDAIDHFKALDSQLATMDSGVAAQLFRDIEEGMRAAGATSQDVADAFPQMFSAARMSLIDASDGMQSFSTGTETVLSVMRGDFSPVMAGAAGATRDFAAEAEAAAEAAAQLSSDVRETLSSLNDYYTAVLGASDATIAVEAAFDKASESAEKYGKNLDLDTEAGRANQAALDGVASAALRQADAMLTAGESTADIQAATQRARDEFIKVAGQMGMTAAEAETLADRYGLIPDQITTRLTQPGMEMSQEEAQIYRELLANLPAEVRTHIRTIPDLSGYWDVNNALNKISGRTVTAYVAMKQYGQAALASGGRVGDAVAAYRGMSDGGRVYGPGTTTSDEAALVALSHGEFVIREWAARMIGYDQLEYANNTGRLPTEHRMQATPAAYTVNYSVPQSQQQAAPQVTNHYTLQMPSASLRDVATVAEFFEHPELHAHHAGGPR